MRLNPFPCVGMGRSNPPARLARHPSTSGRPAGALVMESTPHPEFLRRSDTESMCPLCFETVRADQFHTLSEMEQMHAAVCLQRPDSPLHNLFR